MDEKWLEAPGEVVEATALQTNKGRDLCSLLVDGSIDFAKLIECRRAGENDVVVFDVEVELSQVKTHPIESVERIAAVFTSKDDICPEALALRKEFPYVPHLNLQLNELPRSLCLYDQPYDELKHQWTSQKFVERVRTWLALTAKGKLHDADQPLEPLLWGCVGQIVLPSDLLSSDETERQLRVQATSLDRMELFLIAEDEDDKAKKAGVPYYPMIMTCPMQVHGVIRVRPRNLQTLAEMVNTDGFDLLDELRTRLTEAKDSLTEDDGNNDRSKYFLSSSLIIILAMPKARTIGGKEESCELWAFLSCKDIRSIGIDIGLWCDVDGILGKEPSPPDDKTGENIELDLLNPRFRLSPNSAASLNGWELPDPSPRICAIGTGALGSQVLTNLARSGLEIDTVIDEDRLLPHNLARHSLHASATGYPKAECVAHFLNDIFSSPYPTRGIFANVLRPGQNKEELDKALDGAAILLDISASVAVARYLTCDLNTTGRRVSIFLNPTGTDLVVLAEDAERSCPLDMLEMQFYRALVNHSDLAGHFAPNEERLRYGQSCRDVTSQLAQDSVAVLAGIGSHALRKIVCDSDSRIAVWRADSDFDVCRIELETTPAIELQLSDWRIKLDLALVQRLQELRQGKLPNETGGVLIGSFDMHRRIAYIVDTIPSPPDSDEWPTLYIRGSKGLRRKVESIVNRTDGALQYIGEWHTHPDGASTKPSDDDGKVFEWLTERMRQDGFPGLMMIVGDRDQVNCFIGEIKPLENLLPLAGV